MKKEIGAFEAKNTFGTLLDRVERGEEIIITRHGKPVARLVSNNVGRTDQDRIDRDRIDRDQVQAAFDRIRERARRLASENPGTPAFDWEEVKKLRDEGRP
jgi:prevent-host-death family protein